MECKFNFAVQDVKCPKCACHADFVLLMQSLLCKYISAIFWSPSEMLEVPTYGRLFLQDNLINCKQYDVIGKFDHLSELEKEISRKHSSDVIVTLVQFSK